ncbi:hypothetical protein C8R44DRAFT_259696 [Mycena epipterygia]|nr:hypothetical protein C8R44DRAFT_259696 [Mycena epipterygia]
MSRGAHVFESPARMSPLRPRGSATASTLARPSNDASPTAFLPSTCAITIHPHATSIQSTRAQNTHAGCVLDTRPRHRRVLVHSPRCAPRFCSSSPSPRTRPAAYLRAFRSSVTAHPFSSTTQHRLSTHLRNLARARRRNPSRAFHAVAAFSVVHIRVRGRASKLRPPTLHHNESRSLPSASHPRSTSQYITSDPYFYSYRDL